MHKITKHVMPAAEPTQPTPCQLDADPDDDRWFPDSPKPDKYAVATCWTCYFQSSCARRALAEPLPEYGIWGGYRLAPGPGLERTRAQLAIVAGLAMGPAPSPGAEVLEALVDLTKDDDDSDDEAAAAVLTAGEAAALTAGEAAFLTDSDGQTFLPIGEPGVPPRRRRAGLLPEAGVYVALAGRGEPIAQDDLQIALPIGETRPPRRRSAKPRSRAS